MNYFLAIAITLYLPAVIFLVFHVVALLKFCGGVCVALVAILTMAIVTAPYMLWEALFHFMRTGKWKFGDYVLVNGKWLSSERTEVHPSTQP